MLFRSCTVFFPLLALIGSAPSYIPSWVARERLFVVLCGAAFALSLASWLFAVMRSLSVESIIGQRLGIGVTALGLVLVYGSAALGFSFVVQVGDAFGFDNNWHLKGELSNEGSDEVLYFYTRAVSNAESANELTKIYVRKGIVPVHHVLIDGNYPVKNFRLEKMANRILVYDQSESAILRLDYAFQPGPPRTASLH